MAYTINKNLSWRKLGDHLIILDTVTNKQVHHLNLVGSYIWECINSGQNKDSIVQNIEKKFQTDQVNANDDVEEFINILMDKNIISNE